LIEPAVAIGVCANEVGPVTFGWQRPVILLPASFLGLDEEAQRAILCHEFLHVLRKDWLTNIVVELIGSLFWFHPLVLRLLSQTRLASEQLIDAEVVRITSARESYIAALLAMAGAGSGHHLVPASLFLHRRDLAKRIRLLITGEAPSPVRVGVGYSAVGVLLFFALAVAFNLFPLQSTAAPSTANNVTAELNVRTPQSEVFTVENGMSPPRVIHRVDPTYSDAARQTQQHGLVQLEGMVETDGTIDRLRIVQRVDPDLDQHALDAVKQWQFEPGRKNGQAVPVRLVININFSTRS
jgi:TonB family protein